MRHVFLVVLLCCFAAPTVRAQDTPAPSTSQTADRVQIVEDDEEGVIRFIVNGKEIARLGENGLQVRRSIEYGGTLTDTGSAYFDEHTGGIVDEP